MRNKLLALSAALISVSPSAFADSYSTNLLDIQVGSYSYTNTSYWNGSSFEILADGVRFTPYEFIRGGGSGYSEYFTTGFYLGDIQLLAKPGYRIDGYELSLHGNGSAVGDGSATIGLSMGGNTVETYFHNSGSEFTLTALADASLDTYYYRFADGYVTIDAPYFYNTIYDEYGNYVGTELLAFGWADVTLDSVTLRALVTAVPEPESYAMLLAGLGLIAARIRRREA